MSATLKCMAAVSGGIIETDMESIMQLAFTVDKKGNISLCFGDTITTDEQEDERKDMRSTAYPNCGEAYFGIQSLWLSMLMRRMINADIIEIEF